MNLSPPAVTLRQLQYVVAIAEAKSFRRAAEHCHVSQPSLSAQVAEVEEALGVRLFERDRRRVLVTAAGQEVVERARRVLREVEDLVEASRRFVDPLSGTLKVGVIPTIGPYLLPEVVPALREAWPKLTLVWVEDKSPTLMEELTRGEIDAAVFGHLDPAHLPAELECEPLEEDPFVLAMPAGHPLSRASTPATPEDLQGERVLLLEEGHCLREQALAYCATSRVREQSFRATSLPTLMQMVSGGVGVTLLPRLAVATESRRGDIVLRPFGSPEPSRTLTLAWRRRSPLGEALRKLAGTVRQARAASARR